VLLLPGSGPDDRNGDDIKDGARSQTLKLLAEGLAGQGFASLRIDKRGVGASAHAAPRPQDLTIGTFVDDAAAWARFLGAQPGVRCVVILGHSEGALIAALAAQKVKTCGVVSASGSAKDLGTLIESQNALARRSPELIAKTHEIILALRAGKTVSDVPPELANVFGPDAQAYTRSQINIDPPTELAKVQAPVLVLQGDNDLQVSVDDARALAAKSGGKLVIVAGMTHVLKTASPKFADNVKTYTDPTLPLAPEVIPALADFIRAASAR
jgi:pimeloyl-ACP methyl ester carboxylesterase